MVENSTTVIKSNGAAELFNNEKLRTSLRHAGATDALAEEITAHIAKELVNGMTTADIYRHAFGILRKKAHRAAVRYSLRRSITALGPTGFPFEKFVGELLKWQGYSIALDQTVRGRCVEHEMDLVAWNADKLLMVEAKYHHELTYKTDVKVALYVKARFDDLREGTYRYGSHTSLSEGWLITNTKFTEKAVSYGECSGMYLLGWNYPARGNLHDQILAAGLIPVTSLTSFSDREKQLLMEKGVVLCQSVREKGETLRELGFTDQLIDKAREESAFLCSNASG